MHQPFQHRLILATVAAVSALGACGGGGGEESDSNGLNAQASSVNTSNYVDIGQGAASASVLMAATSGEVGGSASNHSSPEGVARWVKKQVGALPTYAATASVTAAPSTPLAGLNLGFTVACPLGGSTTVTYHNVGDPALLDAGDNITVVQKDCTDAAQRVTGTAQFTLVRASGNWVTSPVYDYEVTVALSNFVITTSAGTTRSTGGLTVAEKSTGLNNFSSSVVASNESSTVPSRGLPYSRDFASFDARQVRTPTGPESYSAEFSANGRLISAGLGYKVQFTLTTVRPFVQSSVNSFPSSGQVLLTATNGATVRITAVNSSSVLIELDIDGNGTVDAASTRLWSQLS